jgi:hypothetical protein
VKLFRIIRDNSLVAVAVVLPTACGTQAGESADPTPLSWMTLRWISAAAT